MLSPGAVDLACCLLLPSSQILSPAPSHSTASDLCCVHVLALWQVMNVDGMTRENVASHLQKYRLYLKRMAGVSAAQPIPAHLLELVS